MAEQTTGIAGSQVRAQESATKSREGRKGIMGKLVKPVIITCVVVIPLLLLWKDWSERPPTDERRGSGTVTPAVVTPQPQTPTGTPVMPSGGQTVFARYEFKVTSTHWSPRIPLSRGRCVKWFTEEPGSPGLVTRTTEKPFPRDDVPSDWEEHGEHEYARTPRYFVQIRSASTSVVAIAEIRPDGQCK